VTEDKTWQTLVLAMHPDAVLMRVTTGPTPVYPDGNVLYSVRWGGPPASDRCVQVQGHDLGGTWEAVYHLAIARVWEDRLDL
jgi:hypothetical protein